MAKIDVFNMCYGVGAVNPFDCLMRQKSKESNSRRDLLYGMMKAARTAWEKWMEANPEEWKKIVQEMRQEDQKFVCTLMLERRIEEVDDDYAEWKAGERGVVMEYEHPLRRQPLRDPGYSLADRRREEEALRTAVEMMKPECRPACAFPLGDVPEVRLEYPHHHWLYTDDRPEPQMLDALGRLCDLLGYHFRPVICVILGERGAEMLRHSTGVDAKALGRLLTVVCAKEREQIWRIEEEQ